MNIERKALPVVTAGSNQSRWKNETNQRHIARLEQLLYGILVQILQEGSYGKGTLVISVQDGIVQNVLRSIEQMER